MEKKISREDVYSDMLDQLIEFIASEGIKSLTKLA